MSQFAPPDASFAPAPQEAPRTSGMAVWALVCSLVFCCPLTTILGALLGVIALASIKAKPHLRGTGLAVAAIIIGLLLSAIWIFGGMKIGEFVKGYMKFVGQDVPAVVMDGAAGDTASFKSVLWGDAAAATDGDIEAFFDTLEQRYGALQSVRLDEQAMSGGQQQQTMGSPIVPFPYLFEFENGSRTATIEMVFSDPARGGFLKNLQSIVVHDDENGDVAFPPAE